MDRHLSKNERKNMDACLRRLKQELLSMREAGDGLHAQMNSMMGALQELKLLQVQTALERLEISTRPSVRPTPTAEKCDAAPQTQPQLHPHPQHFSELQEDPSPVPLRSPTQDHQRRAQNRSSLGTSPSSSSLESEGLPPLRRVSGYTAPQVDYCGPRLSYLPSDCPQQHHQPPPGHQQAPLDLPGILYSLSREGPSLDSEYSQDSMDESSDWTSSLMSRSRNRQPLVLGDNVFADLVGNWLDLPELDTAGGDEGDEEEERTGGGRGGGREKLDSPAHPLRLSRSQEICRRFSLTTNIFKKFLRGVRPDRDKLLKEKPGWMPPTDLPEGELFKRPRKMTAKPKSKSGFYLPFWAAAPQGKGRPAVEEHAPGLGHREPPHSGIFIDRRQPHSLEKPQQAQPLGPRPTTLYLDRRQPEAPMERLQPLFDHNTAVWV